MRDFMSLMEVQWAKGHWLCVGLDPETTPFASNRFVIDATRDLVSSYKPNLSFYLSDMNALGLTCSYIREVAPDVPIILDAKWGDIDHVNQRYARALDDLLCDAVTVNPFVGIADLQSLLGKFAFVLCHTSNPSASEFQTLETEKGPLYEVVAKSASQEWQRSKNCGLVVGATYPERLRRVRQIVGDMPILVPGVGAQGGNVETALRAGGREVILTASRSVAREPRRAVQEINASVLRFLEGGSAPS